MFCDVSSHVDFLAFQCSRKANFWKVSFMYSTRSKLFGAMMLSTVATLMAFYTFLTAVKFSGSQVSLLWLPYPLYVWYFTYCIVLIRLVSKVTLVNTQTSKANDSWMSLNYHQSRLDWKANCIIAALAWTATVQKYYPFWVKQPSLLSFFLSAGAFASNLLHGSRVSHPVHKPGKRKLSSVQKKFYKICFEALVSKLSCSEIVHFFPRHSILSVFNLGKKAKMTFASIFSKFTETQQN